VIRAVLDTNVLDSAFRSSRGYSFDVFVALHKTAGVPCSAIILSTSMADPDDEPLVQLAYDSAARRIVTHNVRHLAPARALTIEVLLPREFAAMIPTP
jgi:predicted nucleic acid-binding protein